MNILSLIIAEKNKLAGMEVFNVSGILELAGRFSLNLIVILILVRWLYFSTTRRKDYLFTYIIISSIVFLLCYLLQNVILQIGFALGLFAIFGIIRYRTNTISIKEMTYLFLTIGISVINALTDGSTSIMEIVFTNLILIAITYALEKKWLLRHESSKKITYEKIELILPEHHEELIADLEKRTGISKISRVEIGEIDFLKDTCYLKIFFETNQNNGDHTNRVVHKKDYAEE
jgi:hypothetical protein